VKYLLVFLLSPLLLYAKCAKINLFEKARVWQFWNTDTVYIHLHQNLTLVGELELHYNKKGSAFHYKHYQGGFCFSPSPHISIMPSYRYTLQGEKGSRNTERCPLLDVTLHTQVEAWWQLSNRCRLLRHRSPSKQREQRKEWLYSNRLKLLSCLSHSGTSLYCSEEFFWERAQGLNENRLIVGVNIPYHTYVRLDLYYMLRSLRTLGKHWENQNVYGIHFSLYF